MANIILEMSGINKSFNKIQALYDINFELKEGEIKGLIGENGAGKSTLMKILTGEYQKDTGKIKIDGEEVEITDSRRAIDLGVLMVYQELNNAPDMTIAENMFIGREIQKFGIVDKKKMNELTVEYLKVLNLKFSPTEKMRNLTVSQMQMVEIVKVVSYKSKIIILDEPTSSITRAETDNLFKIILKLKVMGIGIIFITHKLEELFEMTDSLTIMRDGHVVETNKTSNYKKEELIKLMVGREINDIFPTKCSEFGSIMLKADNLSKKREFNNVSFYVRKGEILGFAGLVGSGRTETMMTLFGDKKPDSGTVIVNGKKVIIKNPSHSVKNKMALIPEDRKLYGLNLKANIKDNIETVVIKRNSRLGFVNEIKKTQDAEQMIKTLDIRCNSIQQEVRFLSGGNQQKVVLAKWLLSHPDIIIFDEPTRGIDIGAKVEIYKIINNLAKEGKAIIIVTSELNEIIGLCNRVIVMYEGQVSGELEKESIQQEIIMSHVYNNRGEI